MAIVFYLKERSMSSSADTAFMLPPLLTMATVRALAERLDAFSDVPDGALTIDASAVQTITTPAVQVLLALIKRMSATGQRPVIKGAPLSFIDAWRDLGLLDVLTPCLTPVTIPAIQGV
jgi:anti-anti-sigma regulatory factor